MAFTHSEFCYVCEKITNHTNHKCNECFKREEQERILKWNALPIEDKLNDIRRRVEKLERGPILFG